MVAAPEAVAAGSSLQRHITFATVIFSGAVYAGATTLPNAVLPQMQGDLSASLDQISWIVTASIVAGALGMPPTPWLAARFGLKALYVTSLVLFTTSSIMIGLSDSLAEVVVWRMLGAFTGAPIMALSATVTLGLYPFEKRGATMAIWSIGLTGGWVFAPAAGAYLADLHTWRMVFLGLAPLGIASIAVCVAFLPRYDQDAKLQFDWWGFVALSVAIAALQIVLSRGQRLDWFDSPLLVAWTVVGVASLYFFVVHSLTTARPFFNWVIFRDRNLVIGITLTFLMSVASFVPLVLIPPMLAQLRGLEVTTIGFILVPRGIVQIATLLLVSPFIGRVDSRILISVGFLIYALACGMMANYNLSIGTWDVMFPFALQGLAMSIIWLPTFHMMYLTLDPKYHTDAGSLIGLTHSVSSSAGVAIAVTMLSRFAQTSSEELGANIVPTNELLQFPEYTAWNLDALEGLAAIQAEVAQQALMIGYVNVYWMMTISSLVAVPIVLLLGASGKRVTGNR